MTYPLDLTKTRLQIQGEVSGSGTTVSYSNRGMVKIVQGIGKQSVWYLVILIYSPSKSSKLVNFNQSFYFYASGSHDQGHIVLGLFVCCLTSGDCIWYSLGQLFSGSINVDLIMALTKTCDPRWPIIIVTEQIMFGV